MPSEPENEPVCVIEGDLVGLDWEAIVKLPDEEFERLNRERKLPTKVFHVQCDDHSPLA